MSRLLFLLDALEYAGAEHQLATLLAALSAEHDVLVVVPDEADADLPERLARKGADVSTVAGLARVPRPAAVAGLARSVRSARADLVHLNLTDQGDGRGLFAAAVTARRPIVATLHNVIPGRSPRRELLSRVTLRPARLTVAVSSVVGDYLGQAGLPFRVVPNGLDPAERLKDPRGRLGLPEGALVVGGIGRLHHQKGWEVLGAAARLVRLRLPETRFVVLGDGEVRDQLTHAWGDDLELRGLVADAASLVGAFDVLAVPSRYESFGLVALEAMHAGVPVVASAVGGLPGVVGDSGWLVPVEDAQALADALVEALTPGPERDRRLALVPRQTATFSGAAMVEGYQRVYRGLLSG